MTGGRLWEASSNPLKPRLRGVLPTEWRGVGKPLLLPLPGRNRMPMLDVALSKLAAPELPRDPRESGWAWRGVGRCGTTVLAAMAARSSPASLDGNRCSMGDLDMGVVMSTAAPSTSASSSSTGSLPTVQM